MYAQHTRHVAMDAYSPVMGWLAGRAIKQDILKIVGSYVKLQQKLHAMVLFAYSLFVMALDIILHNVQT